MNAIEVEGLTKTYAGDVTAVKGLDFEVAPGEVFGLLGPNGAGKSTTVGMLTTTVAPTAGTARLAGFDVTRQALADQRVEGGRQGVALADEQITDVDGGQAPQVVHTPCKAADTRVGGCSGDAVQL